MRALPCRRRLARYARAPERMPVVASTFHPPALLRHAHLQTILPALLRRRFHVRFEPERLELEDGDFLHLGWTRVGARRLAVVSHGLEGEMSAGYIRGMAQALNGAGWDALGWSFRGCGPEPNRLARSYHSGESADLAAVVAHASRGYDRVALIGFSLGGNITLKYLGEAPPHPSVVAGVAVSAPVHLASSAKALDERPPNWLYRRIFLHNLVRKIRRKARCFPKGIDARGTWRMRTIREFDERFTAPLHGFRDADDYWERSSSRQFLPAIRVPSLLLNAGDDPLLAPDSYPFPEAEAHALLHLEVPRWGGHVGFLDLHRGLHPWTERRVVEFLDRAW
jgi:predicted alpha/beta-fold hydrolase